MSTLKLVTLSAGLVLALSIGAVANTTHHNRINACTTSYGTTTLAGDAITTIDVACPRLD